MLNRIPPVTRALLIANLVGFGLQWLLGNRMSGLMLWPIGEGFMPWQPFTSAFMHGNFMHLFFNMFALVMFGAPLEHVWREKRFLTYYAVCVAGAGLCHLLLGPGAPALGASGGVYGLVMAYGLLFPNQRMIIFPFPVPVRAITVAFLFIGVSVFFGVTGSRDGVAHFAHLGGMLFGWLLIRYWRGQPPFKRRGPQFQRRI